MMDENWWVSAMLTAIAVAVFGGLGFNRPGWVKSHMSPVRYRLAAFAHIVLCWMVMGLIYLACLVTLRVHGGAWSWSVGALWLAMLLTLSGRGMAFWQAGPLMGLQKLAGVPKDVCELARQLAESKGEPPAQLRDEVKCLLLSRGIDADGNWLPLAQPAHRLLAQTTALFLQVREWERQEGMRAFCLEAKHDLDGMRQRFDRLALRVSRAFESMEKLGEMRHLIGVQCGFVPRTLAPGQTSADGGERDDDIDGIMRHLVTQMVADICEDIGIFHREICLITARGLTMTSRSRDQLEAAIERMGLTSHVAPRPSRGYGMLAMMVLAMYAGISVQSAQLASGGSDMGASMRSFLITLNVGAALVCAIVPKMHWGFANSGLMRRTPVGFVLGAGFVAALFAACANLAVGALQHGGWDGAIARLSRGVIYLHMPLLTAVTMAWLVQDHRWGEFDSRRLRRSFDALVLAGVWLPAWWCARALRVMVVQADKHQDLLTQHAVWSSMTWLLMGALIGYLLPETVRRGRPRALGDAPSRAFGQPWKALGSWFANWPVAWPAALPTGPRSRDGR